MCGGASNKNKNKIKMLQLEVKSAADKCAACQGVVLDAVYLLRRSRLSELAVSLSVSGSLSLARALSIYIYPSSLAPK